MKHVEEWPAVAQIADEAPLRRDEVLQPLLNRLTEVLSRGIQDSGSLAPATACQGLLLIRLLEYNLGRSLLRQEVWRHVTQRMSQLEYAAQSLSTISTTILINITMFSRESHPNFSEIPVLLKLLNTLPSKPTEVLRFFLERGDPFVQVIYEARFSIFEKMLMDTMPGDKARTSPIHLL